MPNVAPAKPNTTPFVRIIVNAARRNRLTYDAFIEACSAARKRLGLRRPARPRKLPHLIPEDALRRFYKVIDEAGDLQHQIMLRLLFYTAIRVSELTNILVEHVDLSGCRIFIADGKGAKDRYVLFPESFRLALQAHLAANADNRYLFESRLKDRFTSRHVQRIVQRYAREARLPAIHPHLFRHQMLTWLTANGLTDAQIQLVSGHASKKSLEVYQHLSLTDVAPRYQAAVKGIGI